MAASAATGSLSSSLEGAAAAAAGRASSAGARTTSWPTARRWRALAGRSVRTASALPGRQRGHARECVAPAQRRRLLWVPRRLGGSVTRKQVSCLAPRVSVGAS